MGEAADHVKVAITKHTESTLKSVDEACDMRIKKAKKELGADKGIFLSWPNFWAMITLTIYSATIAIFAAVYLCDWSRLWAEVWIPFTFLLSAAVLQIDGAVATNSGKSLRNSCFFPKTALTLHRRKESP